AVDSAGSCPHPLPNPRTVFLSLPSNGSDARASPTYRAWSFGRAAPVPSSIRTKEVQHGSHKVTRPTSGRYSIVRTPRAIQIIRARDDQCLERHSGAGRRGIRHAWDPTPDP